MSVARLDGSREHGAVPLFLRRHATPLLLVLAVFVCQLPHAAALTSQDAGTSAVSKARAALESGHPDAAIRVLRSWLREREHDTTARVLLGNAYEEAGIFAQAQAQLQQAVKFAPDNPEALAALGALYDHSGDPEKAEPLLARAARISNNSEARLAWAVVLAKLHRYHEAAVALRRTEPPEDPGRQIAYFRLRASVDLGNGDAEAAARDMRAALALSPQDMSLRAGTAVAESELAAAQFRAGQLDRALETARRARSVQDSAAIESLVADIQEKQGASLDAVHSYQRAVALEPEREQYWLSLAFELLRHETYKPALLVLKRAEKKFPSSVRIQVAIGLAQYLLQDYRSSAQSLITASLENPGSRMAVDYLGQLQLQQPVPPEPAAVHAVCQYVDAHSGGAEEMAYCGALLARVDRAHGDARPSAGAMRRLEGAARMDPGSATATCELGKDLSWAGRWEEARIQTQACVRLRPDSAEAHYWLAQIYRHFGQAELARRETALHDAAMRQMTTANAHREATVQKFIFTIQGGSPAAH